MITVEQKTRLRAFLFVTSIIMIVVLAFFLVPLIRDSGDNYLIRFRGISVNGLNVGGAVKYQGVEIGQVREIIVDPDDLDAVLVRIRVRELFPMKENMEAKLQFLGITGIRYVELSGGTNEAARLKKGSEIPPGRGISEQAEDVVANIDEAVKNLNALLQAENLDKIALFLDNLEESSGMISQVLAERLESIKNTFANLAVASVDLQETASRMNEISGQLQSGFEAVPLPGLLARADAMLGSLEKRVSDDEMGIALQRTNQVLETADVTIKKMGNLFISQQEEISRTLISLREAMENLSRLSRDLSEDPTSLIRVRRETRRKK